MSLVIMKLLFVVEGVLICLGSWLRLRRAAIDESVSDARRQAYRRGMKVGAFLVTVGVMVLISQLLVDLFVPTPG